MVSRSIVLGFLTLMSATAMGGERLRAYVGENRVDGSVASASAGAAESVKHLQKALARDFEIVPDIKGADFGILVLGRGKGSEELEAQGLVPKATADPRVQGRESLAVDPRMPHWLAVQLVTHADLTQRFVVMRPATVGVYEDCARAIARDVRTWTKANETALIAARGN
jgi:hypothetical protein